MTETRRNHDQLLKALYQDYTREYPSSQAAHQRAREVLVDGASHGARLFQPYPFYVTEARGAYVTDLDGHRIIDFWQGHYANILGHNPDLVRTALLAELERGYGLQTGHFEEREAEFAATLAKTIGAERVRLTTAGTLATMYAIMLSRAYTRRNLVVKAGGGWHGAHPLALKGVHRTATGFDEVDSVGLPETADSETIVTRFNDLDRLQEIFCTQGDRIACLIFEPCPGSGGFIPATAEYMATARELTEKHGALLILDEVITGFRYCAAGVQRLYGVKPDLTTFGKVVGGGMPVSAVAGRADVMELASDKAKERVWFNGGTFCAHPLSLLAGQTMIEHLIAHEDSIYPTLAAKGERLRTAIERAFADRGVLARCTGRGNSAVSGGSLSWLYFPLREDLVPTCADDLHDPSLCDVVLHGQALKIGLLLNKVNIVHGLGAVSLSHTDEDLDQVAEACAAFALRLSKSR